MTLRRVGARHALRWRSSSEGDGLGVDVDMMPGRKQRRAAAAARAGEQACSTQDAVLIATFDMCELLLTHRHPTNYAIQVECCKKQR